LCLIEERIDASLDAFRWHRRTHLLGACAYYAFVMEPTQRSTTADAARRWASSWTPAAAPGVTAAPRGRCASVRVALARKQLPNTVAREHPIGVVLVQHLRELHVARAVGLRQVL